MPGTCVTVTLEGRRPLVAEVQALVAPSTAQLAAAHDQRARQRPARDGARRAAAAGQVQVGASRRLRVDRRRRPPDRAGRRPRGRAGRRRRRAERPARHRAGRDRRGRPGRRDPAGHRHCRAGWPRPPGSASPTRWCRPTRARCRRASRPSRWPTSGTRCGSPSPVPRSSRSPAPAALSAYREHTADGRLVSVS